MSKKIIIVEDDPFSQDFYKFIFSRAGFAPEILEDGDLLIDKIESEDIGLIIMDINLKNTYLKGEKIDGAKLSRYIKSNGNSSKIPILLVTAYSPAIKGNRFFEESLAEDYIIKPITDFNLLLDKVKSMILN